MALKRFITVFLAALLCMSLLLAVLNALIDPFGVFGDRLTHWWSYNMTRSPGVAKIAYLDSLGKNNPHDAYLIGGSDSGSFPTDRLNTLYGADFYHLPAYGGLAMTAAYVLEHYGARHIVVSLSLDALLGSDSADDGLHANIDGGNPALFYAEYLFANPIYAFDKLRAMLFDGYLVNANRVFDAATGAYDNSLRDVEPVGSMEAYLSKYPDFGTAPTVSGTLPCADTVLDSVLRTKELCAEYGASFSLIVSPMYANALDRCVCDDLYRFLVCLADITDYWDFCGYTAAAYEPRYFYDTAHFRGTVGEMMLAVMSGDRSMYIPDGFGVYVTPANAADLSRYTRPAAAPAAQEVTVPVLLYHHISDEFKSPATVTPAAFRAHLAALHGAGYHTVTFADLIAYVDKGTPLPENPLVITFDDGYTSNLTIGAPLLREFGMCAKVNVIGEYFSAGTGSPFFSMEDAAPWVERGTLELGLHSWGLHHTEPRLGAYKLRGEREDDYAAMFTADTEKLLAALPGAQVYAYPYGYYSDITEVILAQLGIRVTLTVEDGVNTLVKGLPQSLRALKRHNVPAGTSAETLIGDLAALQ